MKKTVKSRSEAARERMIKRIRAGVNLDSKSRKDYGVPGMKWGETKDKESTPKEHISKLKENLSGSIYESARDCAREIDSMGFFVEEYGDDYVICNEGESCIEVDLERDRDTGDYSVTNVEEIED